MITRAPRPTSNFYLLDKAISEDKRLSWAARGLLIFLLGKPDNWTVSPAALVNETAGSARSVGRDGVYAILKELKDAGYLRTVGTRGNGGTFSGTDYIVSETRFNEEDTREVHPHTESPDAEDPPHTDLPDTAEPGSANPTQVSIEKKQGLKELLPRSSSFALPDWIPADTWAAFMEIRKGKKAKNTDYAMKLLVNTLTKLKAAGHDPVDIINTSIKAGWSDVYPPKLPASAITPGRRTPTPENFAGRTYVGGRL